MGEGVVTKGFPRERVVFSYIQGIQGFTLVGRLDSICQEFGDIHCIGRFILHCTTEGVNGSHIQFGDMRLGGLIWGIKGESVSTVHL